MEDMILSNVFINVPNAQINQAFENACRQFGEEHQNAISSKSYSWGRTTKRKNKSIAGSPRDIVDTGALKKSYAFIRTSSTRFELRWNAKHASTVFHGKANYPSRNWHLLAKQTFDLSAVTQSNLRGI
jgi:hypothetical protein